MNKELGRVEELGYTLHPYKAGFGTGVAVRYNGNLICDFQVKPQAVLGVETGDGWQAYTSQLRLVSGTILPELQGIIYPAVAQALKAIVYAETSS